eukprot:COSAG01_NODE_15066_length_1378_cov_3.781861_1_plen_228_part_00
MCGAPAAFGRAACRGWSQGGRPGDGSPPTSDTRRQQVGAVGLAAVVGSSCGLAAGCWLLSQATQAAKAKQPRGGNHIGLTAQPAASQSPEQTVLYLLEAQPAIPAHGWHAQRKQRATSQIAFAFCFTARAHSHMGPGPAYMRRGPYEILFKALRGHTETTINIPSKAFRYSCTAVPAVARDSIFRPTVCVCVRRSFTTEYSSRAPVEPSLSEVLSRSLGDLESEPVL